MDAFRVFSIGFSLHNKGYRCLDPTTSCVFVTRHARFNETVFPFIGSSCNPNISTLELTTFLPDVPQSPSSPALKQNATPKTQPISGPTPCSLCRSSDPNQAAQVHTPNPITSQHSLGVQDTISVHHSDQVHIPANDSDLVHVSDPENHPLATHIALDQPITGSSTSSHPMTTRSKAGNDESVIATFTSRLNHEFAIKDLGALNYFLGLEVAYTDNGLFLTQSKYARDILKRADLYDSKPVSTPLATHVSFTADGIPYSDSTLYRSLVGALQYLTITRPDLSYAVNQVSQFLHALTIAHFQSVKRILRYVKGTISFGLTFSRPHTNTIIGYSDADWARCLDTRRSTYGY
ncbi:uncharacterized mitochondrial protein-like protein [Tanacetum coccineum]